jgi:hypothetical protein
LRLNKLNELVVLLLVVFCWGEEEESPAHNDNNLSISTKSPLSNLTGLFYYNKKKFYIKTKIKQKLV